VFLKTRAQFNKKAPKPRKLEDLWLLCFTLVFSRDNTPEFAIVNEGVNVAKKRFGAFAGKVTNAYLRYIEENKQAILEQIKNTPSLVIPVWLEQRWKSYPELLKKVASNILNRPEHGIWGFCEDLILEKKNFSAFSKKTQAMDPGSYELCNWILKEVLKKPQSPKPYSILDMCSAPGGKLIYLVQALLQQGHSPTALATESKLERMNRIKENLSKWNLNSQVKTKLMEWGDNVAIEDFDAQDLILADLPCSGLGTIFTRPDTVASPVEEKDWQALFNLQERILEDALKLSFKQLFVSICSVDPIEIAHISKILGKEPDFKSWDQIDEKKYDTSPEGLVAWVKI